MSEPIRPPRTVSRGEGSVPPAMEPSWRAKLEESWPLLTAGSACVALGVVLALERTTRSIDHLSPSFLFVALGVTGIAGGLASFAVGPEEDNEMQPVAPADGSRSSQSPARKNRPTPAAVEQWIGRPVPDVIVAETSNPRNRPGAPADPRTVEAEAVEIPPTRLLDANTDPRPSTWNEGRLLRLTEEGAVTVYSLEDALRDLELVSQVVHSRRTGGGQDPTDGRRVSSN
jgi:hypothetical protein